MITLGKALEMYLLHCDKELVNGPKAPYWAYRDSIKSIQSKLYSDARQTSGNNFFDYVRHPSADPDHE
tara:strand:- start:299 stop:502 length:204 start_codon:yes stop_codon:yes gene_type:complete